MNSRLRQAMMLGLDPGYLFQKPQLRGVIERSLRLDQRGSLPVPGAANCSLTCSDGRKRGSFVMTGAGSADRQGMSVRELILENLLDLRQHVPFKAALVTFKPTGGATEVPFYSHRYTNGAVRHAIEEFIPSSPAFRSAASRPDEVLDWVPGG